MQVRVLPERGGANRSHRQGLLREAGSEWKPWLGAASSYCFHRRVGRARPRKYPWTSGLRKRCMMAPSGRDALHAV